MPTNDKVNYEVFKVDENGVCTADGGFVGNITSTTIISDNISALNNLSSSGVFTLNNLPTSDPGLEGYVWNDLGTLKVSLGS